MPRSGTTLRYHQRIALDVPARSVSLTVRQTLASRTLDGKVRTFPIIAAKLDAVIRLV
jgi:hypothetical protein